MNRSIKKLLSLFAVLMVLPLGACSSKKELKGFDIDLSKALCQELGVEAKFQEIVWDNKEIELSAKNIDLIWNGFTITDERKEALAFSIPYMKNQQVVIAKKTFTDTIDANDSYKVAVEAGSAGSDTLADEAIFKGCSKVETSDQVTAMTEVLSGTSDLAIIDSVMAGYYLKEETSFASKLTILTDYQFTSEYYGVGGRKTDLAFMAKINQALKSLYDAGTTKKIATDYGLEDVITPVESFTASSEITDQSSWTYIANKKSITIGYTIFAPIAFKG
jgi:polar amino acid transport system substrate-binding protein